ncbi:hypothetical protein [Lentzea flaviverrucosa]|uniref:Uncharacterized protein n=1 Tax=Lentzea flaviverrucosa TaxID=200379 RepID=A0A1H9XNM0_9PSEU|nr:hypothetical protein [Lentzea flaviverrucosa]RDI19663.1 hypothetical protein DFR72_11617 [Lentzea flaviverrucosa]SES47744.1 hypothetical protein SAMN05216195_11617 [Lentzea flaviverrucosa]
MTLIVPGSSLVAIYPVLQHLLDLKDGGWKFLPMEPGHDYLDGFHAWGGGWRDSLRVKDEGDALGIRTDRDNSITWEFAGSLADVVHEFMVLPHPGDRLAPRLARGHGPR